MAADALMIDDAGIARCAWGHAPSLMRDYHDAEWGQPVTHDVALFEKLCLEGFQAGLAWRTILAKRPAFRIAFAGFDPATVAAYGPADVERLLGDAAIVRHRAKIEATIHNAGAMLELVAREGSLAHLVWSYEPDPGPGPTPVRVTSDASRALSRELRGRGWRFLGPTTVHSFLQAMGVVNEHAPGCDAGGSVAGARADLRRP